jgi:hypothetical protein
MATVILQYSSHSLPEEPRFAYELLEPWKECDWIEMKRDIEISRTETGD